MRFKILRQIKGDIYNIFEKKVHGRLIFYLLRFMLKINLFSQSKRRKSSNYAHLLITGLTVLMILII